MSNDFYSILGRLKEEITDPASKMEGSWTADNLQALANELARIYSEDIDTILDDAFVHTATGEELTLACGDYGVDRKLATYAEVVLVIGGAAGSIVSIGMQALSDGLTFSIVEDAVVPVEGSIGILATCDTAGSIGNALAGTIVEFASAYTGLESVTNVDDAVGGYDLETDESLRERTLLRIRNPSSSGNKYDYIKWATEVEGVLKTKVFPLARGNGTVDVVVIADGYTVADAELIADTLAYIEENRPIGADVLVESGAGIGITLSATITLKVGYSGSSVAAEVQAYLQEYLTSIAFVSETVSYTKMAELLFKSPGVLDVLSYQINGTTSSILLGAREFPVAEPVVINGGA